MQVTVHFYSYFKDLTACPSASVELPEAASIELLLQALFSRYPKLEPMKKSMLIAVGVDYQPRDYVLRPGEEVSFFPPVQGG
jgi:molybdopterin converting factor small subunit